MRVFSKLISLNKLKNHLQFIFPYKKLDAKND